MMNRRLFVSLLASMVFAPQARSESALNMTVFKDPNCGCCGAWVNHVRKAGLTVSVVENEAMDDVKQRYGVPEGLTSCHTAEIGDYIVEGHVPSAEIIRLLKERPVAKGLVVAGMPKNSPGMEMTGAPAEKYGVMLFFADKEPIEYAVYSGAVRIS
jgi:hypothetical protein